MMNRKILSRLAALVTTSIWGVSFIFSKLGFEHADPLTLLAYRFLLAFLAMTAIKLGTGMHFDFRGKPVRKLLILGVIQPILYFLCENYGVMYSTATFSGIMIALMPIATLVLATIFLHERPTLLQGIFSVLSVCGVILMSVNPDAAGLASVKGAVLMLGAVFSSAIYFMLSKDISGEFTPFERTYCMFVEGGLFFVLAALVEHRGNFAALVEPLGHSQFIISIVFLGIMASIVAFLCQNYYVTYLTITEAAVFSNLVTVFSIIAGILIMHDPFSVYTIPAAFMIVGGILGVQMCGRKKAGA